MNNYKYSVWFNNTEIIYGYAKSNENENLLKQKISKKIGCHTNSIQLDKIN